jgi:hypothetical protein
MSNEKTTTEVYQSVFFIVPTRIMNLPGLTLAYLKIYETIFQFWNNKKPCYLSNEAICLRTGINSESTVREAFMFFEKHNELKRQVKGNKRYLIQPTQFIEIENEVVDNSPKNSTNFSQGVDAATGGRRQSDGQGVDAATHKNNNLSFNNINKSFYIEKAKSVDKPENSMPQPKEWNGYAETAKNASSLLEDFMKEKGFKNDHTTPI